MKKAADRHLIFAHYFLWFGTPGRSGGWGNWEWKGPGCRHNPARQVHGRRDIAAVDYPALGPYDSGDRGVLRKHVKWAKSSGIDFFAVDWYGPQNGRGATARYSRVDRNFPRLLDVCRDEKFHAAVCYEEKLLFQPSAGIRPRDRIAAGIDHLDHAFRTFGRHPGYMRINRRPVLIVWGDHTLSNDEWRQILSPIQKKFRPIVVYSYFFKSDRRQKQWFDRATSGREEPPGIDGMYPWLLIGPKRSMFARLTAQYKRLQDLKRRGIIDIVVGSVWPNFNDTGVWAWGGPKPRVIPDHNRLYEMTWEFAIRNRADWISIATWNDWNEGSQIEPDERTGAAKLALTSLFSRRFKG